MSRPGSLLRDAALGYASRGIPVLPLHYPVAHRRSARAVADGRVVAPQCWTGCSCGDRTCGQVGKHPLGALVPQGLKEATTNRARVLSWWTRHPKANIGLATGQLFDVLDVDGPEGAAAIQALAAEHGLTSSGPLVRTGGGGWHYYLHPTGLGNNQPQSLEHVDWRGRGGYVVAPPSRHRSGQAYQFVADRDLDAPLAEVPAALLERLQHPQPDRPAVAPVIPLPVADGPAHPYARAALAEELGRVAAARKGERNRRLWEAGRNLYNLVAGGALQERQVREGLLAAAERCGLLAEEPRQTRRTLASARQVGLAHPRQPPQRTTPERHPSPSPPAQRGRGELTQKGR
jgi:Bifunctional DNA primase/polymerase, N-terminal